MNEKQELSELRQKNDELQKTNSRLQELQELQDSLDKLNERYNCLEEEYVKLKGEYSENIIIQSMNEMKTRYDIMMKTTVPSYKFTLLNEKYNNLVKNRIGCSVLIDYIIKLIQKSENDVVNRRDIILKAELELITVKEILEN